MILNGLLNITTGSIEMLTKAKYNKMNFDKNRRI